MKRSALTVMLSRMEKILIYSAGSTQADRHDTGLGFNNSKHAKTKNSRDRVKELKITHDA